METHLNSLCRGVKMKSKYLKTATINFVAPSVRTGFSLWGEWVLTEVIEYKRVEAISYYSLQLCQHTHTY